MPTEPPPPLQIRAAATVVLWREGPAGPEVLMGQRGAGAAFMASKYVFPGGAVDAADDDLASIVPLASQCIARLVLSCPPDAPSPNALATAAMRELLEETGLRFVSSQGDARHLRFIFRAITPPGRSRRFDARFFLAHASSISGDTDDFGAASDELSHLHWIGITQARALDLPFITEVVLAEVSHLLRSGQTADAVPFFDNSGQVPTFRRLG